MRIPILKSLLSCFMLLFALPVFSATSPVGSSNTTPVTDIYKKISSLKVRDIQRVTGKKMTLKQKIAFVTLKHTFKKKSDSSHGKTALLFGIAGVVLLIAGLVIPYILLALLAAAIIAIGV